MAEITPESTETQMDGMRAPDEPPDLQCANRRYKGTGLLAECEQLLLDRLNAVWKRICVSLKLFHVTATAGPVEYVHEDYDSEGYKLKINLTCKLFTADLQLVYTEDTRGSYADDCDSDISYKLENMVILHKSTILQPLVLDNFKKVYQTSIYFRSNPNHESELMECMFVPYDILCSMRSFLIYNKMLIAVQGFRKSMTPSIFNALSDDTKTYMFKSYRKMSEESTNELLRSLLLECRSQWVVPERMEYIRMNTLSTPEMVNPV